MDFRPGLPRFWADERAMRQICLNLLSNAVKFTPQGGLITVRTGLTPAGEGFFTVRDNGPGIPKEEMPQVMRSFGQGSLALELSEGGTGLGLPIVRGLAELHGGRFELRSEPGVGTEATVFLPKARVMSPVDASGSRPPKGPAQSAPVPFRGAA